MDARLMVYIFVGKLDLTKSLSPETLEESVRKAVNKYAEKIGDGKRWNYKGFAVRQPLEYLGIVAKRS